MASRTIHGNVVVTNTFVPFIVSVNDLMPFDQVAAMLHAAAVNAVREAIPQLATEVRITLEVGE